jgi:hypothetical protein
MTKRFIRKIDPKTGVVTDEQYLVDGQLHRNPSEGPARTQRSAETGKLIAEYFYANGKLHREDGPAKLEYFISGALAEEAWYRHGAMHRIPEEGPAFVQLAPNGITTITEYSMYGRTFRNPADGPCLIERDEDNGMIVSEIYSESPQAKARRYQGRVPFRATAPAPGG